MFDMSYVLKRAWQILWNYRVLWIFALLLALSGGAGSVGGGGGGGGGGGSGAANLPATGGTFFDQFEEGLSSGSPTIDRWAEELKVWAEANVVPFFATEERALRSVIAIAAIVIGISLLIALLLALVRYPSETAVMRAVNDHEEGGVRYKFKEAWALGWNARAWRVFLVDLLIGTPAFTFVMLLIGLIAWMAYLLVESGGTRMVGGSVVTIILAALSLVLFIFFMVLVSFLRQHVVRFAAIEDGGVGESFRKGWSLFKSQFKYTFLTGLVLVGVGMVFGIVLVVAAFLLIPAYALMALPGALVAAIPGGLAYWLTGLSAPQVVAVIVAAIVAIPFFFAIVFLPLGFLSGMFAVYSSAVWTLAFRQLKVALMPLPVIPDTPPSLPE